MPKRTIILLLVLSGALVVSMFRLVAPPTTLIVEFQADGVLLLDDQATSLEDLQLAIQVAVNDDPKTIVIIYADKNMPSAEVVRVAQIVEQSGAAVELNARLP